MSTFDTKKNPIVRQSQGKVPKTSKRPPKLNRNGIRILSKQDGAFSKGQYHER